MTSRLACLCLATLFAGLCATTVPARAQDYSFLDDTEYLAMGEGLRVYFDATVDLSFGGIIASPMYQAASTTATPSVWLVLVNPGAATMSGWQAQFRLTGEGSITSATVLGEGAANAGAGDDYLVTYASPRPTTDVHVPLLRLDLLVQTGGSGGFPFGEMFIYTAPAAGGQAMPGWTTGAGAFRPTHSLTSAYHGWTYPCMTLNSPFGVTAIESDTWGGVKALFRPR
ncbi:MAG: hypothetical protein IPK64_03625 [bacterium]|nr:hypothetical protein [bacterium]